MSLSRWKLMAGFLGLSAGGLAMCCAQTSPVAPVTPTPVKLEIPALGSVPIQLDPVVPAAPPKIEVKPTTEREIEIVLPVLTSPKALDIVPVNAEVKPKVEEKKTASPAPLNELPGISGNYEPSPAPKPVPKPETKPSIPVPVGLDLSIAPVAPAPVAPAPVVPTPAAPIKVSDPIEAPAKVEKVPTPKTPTAPETPNAIKGPVPATPLVQGFEIAPPAKVETPPPPAKLTVKEVPAPSKPEVTAEPGTAKLKMLLRMGTGTPRFEIRSATSEELLFKVYGDKIEMQSSDTSKGSPLAGVTASGKVRFTGPGVEGTCDSLTLLSGTGEVLMKGNVQLKTKTGRTWSELAAEKMMYQIGLTGLKSMNSTVTPTSYRSE